VSKMDVEVAKFLLGDPSGFDPPCQVRDSVPLWECPCRECWELEMLLCDHLGIDDQKVTYTEWRKERS